MLPERFSEGVKVIVEPLVATEPETELPPPLSLNELVDTVEPLMVSERVADTVALADTFVAPLEGPTEFTDMYVGAGFVTPVSVDGGDDVANETSDPVVEVPKLLLAYAR